MNNKIKKAYDAILTVYPENDLDRFLPKHKPLLWRGIQEALQNMSISMVVGNEAKFNVVKDEYRLLYEQADSLGYRTSTRVKKEQTEKLYSLENILRQAKLQREIEKKRFDMQHEKAEARIADLDKQIVDFGNRVEKFKIEMNGGKRND